MIIRLCFVFLSFLLLVGCKNIGSFEPEEALVKNHFEHSLTYHAVSQSYRIIGEMSGDDGQVIEIVYFIKGTDRVRVTMRQPSSDEPFFEGWTNGDRAWRNGELCDVCMAGERTFDALNPVFKLLMADQALRPGNTNFKTSSRTRIKNEKGEFDQIELESDDYGLMQARFEMETGLLSWIEGDAIGEVGYGDYRKLPDGRYLPYLVEGDYDGTYLIIKIQDISLGELPDAFFEDPGLE